MVAGGYCFADSRRSRAWESVGSGGKERGGRGRSILGLPATGRHMATGIDSARGGALHIVDGRKSVSRN
jgi:hypothetical protein